MVFASLFFYSWWNIIYLPLILGSILFNFTVGTIISRTPSSASKSRISSKSVLVFGIVANILLLGYFKYMDFFISNVNLVLNSNIDLLYIVLPLGISFFTFTQIAYLVDAYKGEVKETDYLNYTLFVTFFPHLLAGPILHHKEMMPQFDSIKNKAVNYRNISAGLFLFSIGLFKKAIIADTFAKWANAGFDHSSTLSLFEAWAASLSYTFQLYFDFSGYTDMALGIALLFNIKLPINFNSPYKALNIQDFWRRWHITLSRFLRDYIYIPLGGNKQGEFRTYSNLFTVFLIGGLWHGASWMFVIWGALHGIAIVIHRAWQQIGLKMNIILAWFITFNFINITWVFFRAKEWGDAVKIIKSMFFGSILIDNKFSKLWIFHQNVINVEFGNLSTKIRTETFLLIIVSFFFLLIFKNSNELANTFRPSYKNVIFVILLIVFSLAQLNSYSKFLYFNF